MKQFIQQKLFRNFITSARKKAVEQKVTNVEFLLGDSIELLKEITPKVLEGAVFFLDVHQSGGDISNNGKNHVPLLQELDVILSHKVKPSIYIGKLNSDNNFHSTKILKK